MNQNQWNEGLNHIDDDLVEEYVEQKDKFAYKKKLRRKWLRVTAVAACIAIVAGAVIAVPLLNRGTDIAPYLPNGDPWSPQIDSDVESVVLSAEEVGGLFDTLKDSNGTNQYTELYTPQPEYLNISPLPNAEYLPVYSLNGGSPSKSSLKDFIKKYLQPAANLFGIKSRTYEIEKGELWNGDTVYVAEVVDNPIEAANPSGEKEKGLRFVAKGNALYFDYYTLSEKRLRLNGNFVSVLESDTDAQIKEKLKDTVDLVCNTFGREYTDIKIIRDYSHRQLDMITVYLYTPEETIFPEDFAQTPMTSDYIVLTLYTDWGSGLSYHWGGSREEAFLTEVSVYEAAESWNSYYGVKAKAQMLALEEAEELLKKGYVFGGHSCPLCMELQPEVDFSEYTYVDIEYLSNSGGELYIPFYAFYKYIGETEYGIKTYAKTYVPAVKVSGLEEYFNGRTGNHCNIGYDVVG